MDLWLVVLLLVAVAGGSWLRISKLQSEIQSERERLDRLKQEKEVVYEFLHDLGEAFTDEVDRRQLLEIILKCSVKVSSAQSGIIYIKQKRQPVLAAEAIYGLFPPPFKLPKSLEDKLSSREEYLHNILRNEPIPLHSDNSFAQVCQTREPIWICDASLDRCFPQPEEEALKIHSLIVVPLKYRQETFGVLALAKRKSGGEFTVSDFEIAKAVADQAAFSLHNASVYSQLAEKALLDHDLEAAREIQRILLPEQEPQIPGYDVAAINIPAKKVSGDYYDFLPIDQTHWGFVIADVSGKGVPASLIMGMCRTVLRTHAAGCTSAAEVLRKANRVLYPDIREDMFISMAYLILDSQNHTITLAKAGHDAPLLCTMNHTKVEPLQAPGIAVGIDSGDVFDSVMQDVSVPLQPGDTILLYTDGIKEAVDEDGQEFGRDQIRSALLNVSGEGAKPLVTNMIERVARFRGNQVQNDDITLVALKRKPL